MVRSTRCGGYQGSASAVGTGSGVRQFVVNISGWNNGGTVSFYHKLGAGGMCDFVEHEEGIVLEFRSDPWSTYVPLWTSNTNISHYQVMRAVYTSFPPTLSGSSPQIRWRQVSHSGSNFDEWMVDNIVLTGHGTV
jgi:hypothetical protein